MKSYTSANCLTLALLAVLGLAEPVAAQVPVPFRGGLVGSDVGVPIAGMPPLISVTVTATGNATLIGQFNFILLATVNPVDGSGSGNFLFTAANGDTVFGSISGKATFTPPNVLTILETATITGGTGRFAGASGSLAIVRLKNTLTNETTASFAGTILFSGKGN